MKWSLRGSLLPLPMHLDTLYNYCERRLVKHTYFHVAWYLCFALCASVLLRIVAATGLQECLT